MTTEEAYLLVMKAYANSAATISTIAPTPYATPFRIREPEAVGKRAPHCGQTSACVEMGLPQSRQAARDMGPEGIW